MDLPDWIPDLNSQNRATARSRQWQMTAGKGPRYQEDVTLQNENFSDVKDACARWLSRRGIILKFNQD